MSACVEQTRVPILEPETDQMRSSHFGAQSAEPMECGVRNSDCGIGDPRADYRAVFDHAVARIEAAYGLKVTLGPVIGSYTGQFDGLEIWVDPEKDPEEALFILVHLFGHTVQWNLDEHLREVGLAVTGVKEEDLPRIYEYERQASQLGLGLLAEIGHAALARWLTDCFGSDWKFLSRFYRTGEKLRFEKHCGADEPLLSPLPIPRFTPQRWPPRGSF